MVSAKNRRQLIYNELSKTDSGLPGPYEIPSGNILIRQVSKSSLLFFLYVDSYHSGFAEAEVNKCSLPFSEIGSVILPKLIMDLAAYSFRVKR